MFYLWSGSEVRGRVIIWGDGMLSKLRHQLPSQSVTTPLVAEVAKSSQRSQLTQQSVHFDHSVLFIGRVLGQDARYFARIVRVVFLGKLRRRPPVVVGHRSQHSLKKIDSDIFMKQVLQIICYARQNLFIYLI